MERHPEVVATYGAVSRANHWIMAAIFLGALGLGLVMGYAGLEREARGVIMPWHKLLGVAALVFGLWRVGWRLAKGFPPPVAGTPAWQAVAAKAAHWVLLAMMLLMPLSGIVMSMSGGRALEVFGLEILPVMGTSEALHGVTEVMHGLGGLAVTAVIVLHVAAALKHQVIDRDGTLSRMLRGRAAA